MSDDTDQVTESVDDPQEAAETSQGSTEIKTLATAEVKTVATGSSIKLKPLKGDINVDFTDPDRGTFKPRKSKGGKVFTDGFKIPGFNAYTDLPGKICVNCGFRALKFSTQCSKCGGELVPEEED